MIKHIVIWTLKDPADARSMKALLDGCKAVVPGILEFEVGIRERDASGCTYNTFAIQREHKQAACRLRISGEVTPLVIQFAVVQIREVTKHLDTQCRNSIQPR